MNLVNSIKCTTELFESFKTEINVNKDDCLKIEQKEIMKKEKLEIKSMEIMENKKMEIGVSKAKNISNQPY